MRRSGTTRTTERTLRAALVAGALAAGLAGCGSGDDDATTAASEATPATTAPAPTTTGRSDAGKTATATDVTPEGTATGATPTTATVTEATPSATAPTRTTATVTKPIAPPAAKAPSVPTASSGSAADQAAVRQTVRRYMRAFVRGDGKTACALLSDRQRRLLGTRGAGACAQAVETAQAAVAKDATVRGTLASLRVGDVAVNGDRAVGSATVKAGGRRSAFPIELERTAGGWRISSSSPAGG